ncbi:MAG: TlpA family protein disulfide reductase [Spirochaetales bacterium]|nr:TlpA family protein disulfide reductase [Spirochaetales bacterium]
MKSKGFVVIIIFLLISASGPLFAVEVGENAPAFVLTDIDKNYVFSKKLYGTGWVLVDFYATWCENCNEELPYIEELYDDFADSGFQAMLLATDDEGHSVVKPYFASAPTTLTVLIDKYKKAVGSFGVQALPSLFLVDPDGKIAFKSVGYHEEDIVSLRAILAEAYNE